MPGGRVCPRAHVAADGQIEPHGPDGGETARGWHTAGNHRSFGTGSKDDRGKVVSRRINRNPGPAGAARAGGGLVGAAFTSRHRAAILALFEPGGSPRYR